MYLLTFYPVLTWSTLKSSGPSRLREEIWLVWQANSQKLLYARLSLVSDIHVTFHITIVIDPLLDWSPGGGIPSDRLRGDQSCWLLIALRSEPLGSTVSLLAGRHLRCKRILLRFLSALKSRVLRDLLSAWFRPGWYNQSLSPCNTSHWKYHQ